MAGGRVPDISCSLRAWPGLLRMTADVARTKQACKRSFAHRVCHVDARLSRVILSVSEESMGWFFSLAKLSFPKEVHP